MKEPRISKAIENIDDKLIEGATKAQKKKSATLKITILAATLAVLTVTILLMFIFLNQNDDPLLDGRDTVDTTDEKEEGKETLSSGNNESNDPNVAVKLNKEYKNSVISSSELSIEWPWQYKTIFEKFPTVTYNKKQYWSRQRTISTSLLGEKLTEYTAKSYDDLTEKEYTETFEIYKIRDISPDCLIAVGKDGQFAVYLREKMENEPATLGKLFQEFDLKNTLSFNRFSVNQTKETQYYELDPTDADYILYILSLNNGAVAVSDNEYIPPKNYLSFTITSEALGVYKKALYITEDGYLWTNIFNYSYIYYIGEDTADLIISTAKAHSKKVNMEPYEYTLSGTITGVGENYVKIDDSISCKNSKDGEIFTIQSDDIRFIRCIKYNSLKIGDTVVIGFPDEILLVNKGTITTPAHYLAKGKLINGNVAVPE